MLNKAITHDKYEKITDDLLLLSPNIILKFTVGLTNYSDRFGRQSYHKEFEYSSAKSKSNVISIKRSFDFYLSLENTKSGDNKEFIRIGVSDIYGFRHIIKKASEWYTSKEYSNLFARKNNRLIITRRIDPLILDHLPMGKYIKLEPIIVTNINTDEDYIALRMYLSSEDNYGDISVNKLMGLMYILDTINMYESAQLLLNYIQRPEFGSNIYSLNSEYSEEEPESKLQTGRKIDKNISFFDKMKGIE